MNKPTTPTTQTPARAEDTEIVTAGQPSAKLLAALKEVGAQITDEQIGQAYTNAEGRRTAWQCAAIETGLLLLAKKQTVKHGAWGKWLDSFAVKFVSRDKFETSPIQLSKYAYIAQHFLADQEQSRLERIQGPDQAAPLAVEELASLANLPHSRRMAVIEAITAWVQGRSLRQMLSDLRRADLAAEREDIGSLPPAVTPATKTVAELRYEATAALTAPAGLRNDPLQLQLWSDFTTTLNSVDHLLKDDDLASRSKKELWRSIVAKLQEQVRLAKARLDTIAD